ncbi:hypothetical protein FGIG_02300 [Fasciola gigantica]|uniref:Uncharacterized protein n=1 Tax=Fasciola gigantica TaxID=46835 RepID=A0A504YLV6_FASGI|nr:hypothetical protein FGIG_02300 [Fasciola gigantica]
MDCCSFEPELHSEVRKTAYTVDLVGSCKRSRSRLLDPVEQMTYNTRCHEPDQVNFGRCNTSSRTHPRLGTMIGTGSIPICPKVQTPSTQTSVPEEPVIHSSPTRPTVNLEHVTQRRRERIMDWPQFRLRRKVNATKTNDLERGRAGSKQESGANRQPIKAVHPGFLSRMTQCSVDHMGSVATVIDQATRLRMNADPTSETVPSSVTSSRGRRGISTNPHVRRRFSADGMPIQGDTDDMNAPSPAKRIYQVPGSAISSYGNPTDSFAQDSVIVSRDSQNLTFAWNRLCNDVRTDYADTRKDATRSEYVQTDRGRHSIDCPVQRATKSETHIFPPTKISGVRKSHLFSGIRRSARQTLDTLCKALRNSTTNLTDMAKSDRSSSVETGSCSMKSSAPRRHSDMSLNRLMVSESSVTVDTSELSHGELSRLTRVSTRIRRTAKLVELRRAKLQDPFGIFVTKSDLGFRVTRLIQEFIRSSLVPD